MRYLTIICSFYMLLLALMPCEDALAISLPQNQQTIQQDSGTTHCNDEACPPFCTCTCCSVVRHFLTSEPVVHIEKSVTTTYLPAQTSAVQKLSLPIWQPPQNA